MTRLRVLAPLLAAAALAAVAVATVRDAGCDDPGYYAPIEGGYELVGGCLAAGDLLVADPAPAAPAEGVDAGRG
ncbi:MAG: hypothetical protein NTW05_01800 [Pseudonocardiales bacterium]|jgi:hypothetical protein|nr:hypothetical protein [Pseudonocardiales bacterium]